MITVAVYLHQRAYGGPEEGGWWYNAYSPVLDPAFLHYIQHFPSTADGDEDADSWRAHVQHILDTEHNVDRGPVHSVNSDGVYTALITEGYELTDIPTRRPHYE